MTTAFKIVRYALAALMAGASFAINANAATLHINEASNDGIVVSAAVEKTSEDQQTLPF